MFSLITIVLAAFFLLHNVTACFVVGGLGQFQSEGSCKFSIEKNCYPSADCPGKGVIAFLFYDFLTFRINAASENKRGGKIYIR